jgi:hypothetical protein
MKLKTDLRVVYGRAEEEKQLQNSNFKDYLGTVGESM